jgi:hypothetical protein
MEGDDASEGEKERERERGGLPIIVRRGNVHGER